jgi:hypothetical protein
MLFCNCILILSKLYLLLKYNETAKLLRKSFSGLYTEGVLWNQSDHFYSIVHQSLITLTDATYEKSNVYYSSVRLISRENLILSNRRESFKS